MSVESNEEIRLVDQAAKRKAARERKRKSRANQKSQAIQQEKGRFSRYCKWNRLVGMGELEPDVFAGSPEELLLSARRFARAAALPDIQQDESLNDFERRVYGAVCKLDEQTGEWIMPLLSLETGKFDKRFETVHDEHVNSVLMSLPEDQAPVDIAKLPALPPPRERFSRSVDFTGNGYDGSLYAKYRHSTAGPTNNEVGSSTSGETPEHKQRKLK